ncbi:MAG: condensation domain-containing protein, partial [Bacteroidia bacterium]
LTLSSNDEVEKQVLQWIAAFTNHANLQLSDNFFSVGGNSLKAVQLINRINANWKISFPLKEVFINHTIYDLIKSIKKEIAENEVTNFSIEKTEAKTQYELSPAQRRMWMLDQIIEEKSSYNLLSIFSLKGKIDIEKIKEAVLTIIKRHEILRTNFVTIDGLPYQIIQEEILLEKLLFIHNEAISENILAKEFAYRFDLAGETLIRFHLISHSKNEYTVIINVHHIVYDGWCDAILMQEIQAVFAGKALEILPIQYKDYANWQLQNEKNPKLANYWNEQFKGFQQGKRLFSTENIAAFSQEKVQKLQLPLPLSQEIREFVAQQKTTTFSFFYAVYALTLAHFSKQNDFVIGTVFSGRTHTDIEKLIGLFLNTLAIRNRFQGNMSLFDFFQNAKKQLITTFEHQDYPIEALISSLQLPYNTERNPLFEVGIVMQNYEVGNLEMPDFQVKMLENPHRAARLDLTLYIQEMENQFQLEFEYDNQLLTAQIIANFSQKYLQFAEMLLHQSDKKIKQVVDFQEIEGEVNVDLSANKQLSTTQEKAEIHPELKAIFEKLLPPQPIDAHTHFFQAGGYSLKALQLCHEISQRLGLNISLKKIYENPTLAQLSTEIALQKSMLTTTVSNKIFALKPFKGTAKCCFFIPPVLGSATIFKSLSDALPYDGYGLQYAGLEEGEAFEPSILAMALRMTKDILSVISQKKEIQEAVIIGYSMGALLAYEIANLLNNRRLNIKLVLLDKAVETEVEAHEEPTETTLTEYIQQTLADLQQLDDSLFHSQYVQRVKSLYLHNVQLMEKYAMKHTLALPILAIEATKTQPKINMQEWQKFTSKKVIIKEIGCTHYEILTPEYIDNLREMISEYLY